MEAELRELSQEAITNLMQKFPSNYEEMHERQLSWSELKEKLPQALEYIKALQNQHDETSLRLLANLSHNVGVFCTHVVANYPQGLELLSLALSAKERISSIDAQSVALMNTKILMTV